jgi:peptide/nickel transport system substrate-binding protein
MESIDLIFKGKLMKTKIVLVALFLIILMGISACGGQGDTAENFFSEKNAGEDPLIIRMAGSNIGVPNPFRHTTRGPGMARMRLLYDSLLDKDETGNIPWLARSWEVNDEKTVYTFHLRENALWHDGHPLTAEDIAFTFSYYKKYPPVFNSLITNGEYIVSGTKVLDENTIEITLTEYDTTSLMRIGYTRIVPKHIWENVDDPISYDGEGVTVGSGPYVLDSLDTAQGAYKYTAFEKYWGPIPAAAAIEWVPVSDSVLAFENGEIDLVKVSADLLSRYENNDLYTIQTVPSLHSYRLMMNMETVPELRDVNLRKALAFAINRQKLIDTVMRGAATLSSMGYVPMESAWYNPGIEQYSYDIDKAKKLLNGRAYSFSLLTDNSAEGTKTAEMIKIALSAVGIDLRVESMDSKTRDNAVITGKYQLLLINSGGLGGDPDYIRDIYAADSSTIKGWDHEELMQLLDAQAKEDNPEARKRIIYKAQKIISEEVPMIMLFGAVENYVYRHAKFDGWMCQYDSNKLDHSKLSYIIRDK